MKLSCPLLAGLFMCQAILSFALPVTGVFADEPLKVLIIGGQNNHDWTKSTPYMKSILDVSGGFDTTINNAPPKNAPTGAWDAWRPDFGKFDCVILDYNGAMWPDQVKRSFESYIAEGGGRS